MEKYTAQIFKATLKEDLGIEFLEVFLTFNDNDLDPRNLWQWLIFDDAAIKVISQIERFSEIDVIGERVINAMPPFKISGTVDHLLFIGRLA